MHPCVAALDFLLKDRVRHGDIESREAAQRCIEAIAASDAEYDNLPDSAEPETEPEAPATPAQTAPANTTAPATDKK